jgi:heavy metal sensor kinase
VITVFRSTRGRLMLAAVAMLAVALLIVDGTVLASTTAALSRQSDDVLVAQSHVLVADLQDANGQLTFGGSDIPGETQSGIAVDAAVVSGSVIVAQTANQPLPQDKLLSLAAQAATSGSPVWADVVDSHHVNRRVYAAPLMSGNGGQTLVVSRSVGELLDAQTRTLVALLLVSIALLVVGGGLSYWLTGRALRPVRTIAATARSISERDLKRRVDVKAPPDELGDLVDTFNAMLGRLDAGFNTMGRFTADASHELRAPLALMRSELDGALSHARSKAEYVRTLESLSAEVDHLSRLADQLLILARADAGALVPAKEEVDVADFLHETGARWQTVARQRGVRVEVGAPDAGFVQADPALLRRVLDNLLDNAIRHTREGTAVELKGYDAAGGWNIEVADHGLGVPAEYHGELFSRFARPDTARSHEDGGAGLGLALSAAIARAHGGTLELVDSSTTGSTFRLQLP